MKDINTYTLMLELCRRLTDHCYDPDPKDDPVLKDLEIQLGMLYDLHDMLKDHVVIYKSLVEDRSEDA